MLKKLSISNYAIIDELEIGFSSKLNVITGETGAGKSILVGALGLILGERADTAALVNKDKKCIVEALFDETGGKEIQEFLADNDLDLSDELVIRREIGTNGKSRAFINDTPVNLVQLNAISRLLVDLHQQFDTMELTGHDFQRRVLDALAGHAKLLEDYMVIFSKWEQLKKETQGLKEQKSAFDREADYNRFQFKELEEAGFKENELEDLDAELKMMNNSEAIKAVLDKVQYELKESDTPVVSLLKSLTNQLNAYASIHSGLDELVKRMQAAQVELQDLAGETERISNHISYDAQRAEELNQRLSLGYKLQKKHGLNSTAGLLDLQQELENKIRGVLEIDDRIAAMEKELESLENRVSMLAGKISEGRHHEVTAFEEQVNKLLSQVGMPHARLKVSIEKTGLNPSGYDKIEFLFNANLPAVKKSKEDPGTKQGEFLPLRKVASGGELSRLMLCIKSLVARSIDLPTQIFDEIESGISGEAARQVGIIMKNLSARRQLICITHQPQIAGKADTHLFVYKQIIKDKVRTNIRLLDKEERITAIAKMLSGEKPTAAAMENAREMIMN